ncbi:MAG: DUF1499 domain-containing protein [Gammaproteobacteria bacterium]|jgi:hypothetical protein|nr:DUF1499 domain-containing protein [Gammaproteobacteria bacterium]MBT5203783.1 DUF1499 domain-containing protein [Gammaproteobacteria bacterium]MBT5600613.1 DUF1499 domain-containing protein [Gammaproteobacteria bacterium]
MSESKTSSKVLLLMAVCMVLIMAFSPLSYRFGWVPLLPSLGSLGVAILGSALIWLSGLVMLIAAVRKQLSADRKVLLVALVLAALPVAAMIPQLLKVGSVPPIHDISTDTVEPPEFELMVKRRIHAMNDLEYADADHTAEQMAALQEEFYPEVQSLVSDMSVQEAQARARTVLEDMGLDIIASGRIGLIEATATTFWFGFKDDLVVRIRAEGSKSIIDVRSVSRVGQSDLGVNAARILNFLEKFASA